MVITEGYERPIIVISSRTNSFDCILLMKWDGWLFGLTEPQNRADWTWRSLSSHQSRLVWAVWKQSNSLNQSRLGKQPEPANRQEWNVFTGIPQISTLSVKETIFQCYRFSSTQSLARQKFPWWQESPSSSPGNPSHDNDHVLHNKTHTEHRPRSLSGLRYQPDILAADCKGLISAVIIIL